MTGRWVRTLASALVLQATASQGAAAPPSVYDEWWTPGFNARIRIEPCADRLCGTIVWVWHEHPQDIVDKRPLVGQRIIVDMRPDGPARWNGGRIYNPEDGRQYEASVVLKSANNLLVEGCVMFFCKTQVWRRADGATCPPVAN